MRFEETSGWHDRIDETKLDVIGRVSDAIANDVTFLAPKDTGAMAESVRNTVVDPNTAVIEVDAPALWVEDGHRVVYRNAQGQKVYTNTFVPPNPFMKIALYKDREEEL